MSSFGGNIEKSITKAESVFSKILEYIMGTFFIIIFLIVFTLVLLRYGLNKSIFGGAEFVTVLFIYSTALGAALLFRERSHIRILFFLKLMPRLYRKIVIVLAYLINLVFHFLVLYFSIEWIQTTGGFRTAILRVPHWVMEFSIPVYACLVMVYIVRNIYLVVTKNKYLDVEIDDINVELEL